MVCNCMFASRNQNATVNHSIHQPASHIRSAHLQFSGIYRNTCLLHFLCFAIPLSLFFIQFIKQKIECTALLIFVISKQSYH